MRLSQRFSTRRVASIDYWNFLGYHVDVLGESRTKSPRYVNTIIIIIHDHCIYFTTLMNLADAEHIRQQRFCPGVQIIGRILSKGDYVYLCKRGIFAGQGGGVAGDMDFVRGNGDFVQIPTWCILLYN